MDPSHISSLQRKRTSGEFFTSRFLAEYVGNKILTMVEPDLVLEPYAGEGVLLEEFINKNIPCIVNEKDLTNFLNLKNKFHSKDVKFYNRDFIASDSKQIFTWLIPNSEPKRKNILIYTNPPFGTVSTNKLSSKHGENQKLNTRQINIEYHGLEKYGKGDLILPAIGKILDFLLKQNDNNYYLAFYSPLGLFCKRKRYSKLLNELLENFTFKWGEIFSGEHFQNVNKKKPICITLWHFEKGIQSVISSIKFNYENTVLPLKPVPLLKDYWRYDTRKVISGEIAVQGNDRFNVAAPKMFHMKVSKGGSELVPKNVVKTINIGSIPDELALGLWSVAVGYRSLTNYPLYMDNAYVHIPDFSSNEVQKILALVIISVIINEKRNNYTKGRIGFTEESNQFQFGNDNLTKGALYLVNKFEDLEIGEDSLIQIFNSIKLYNYDEKDLKDWKKEIRNKIENILMKTGYYQFIPIPIEK